MADSHLARLIGARRKRLVATILGHVERNCDLDPDVYGELRFVVLGALDEFCDLTRDILKVVSEDVVVNQHALELLEQLHRDVRQLRG